MAGSFSRLTRSNIRKLKPGERITESGITAKKAAPAPRVGKESDGTTWTQCQEFIETVRVMISI